MFSERFRPIIEPLTSGAGRTLARAHVSPNAMTTVGLLAVLAVSGLIAAERTTLAGVLLIPAVLLDVLDGAIARASGRVTRFGAFWDSVADRLSDGALLGAASYALADDGSRALASALLALVLSLTVPYARAKAEAIALSVPSGPGERAERALILIAGLIFGLLELAMWTISALAAWTLVVRCRAVRRATLEP